MDRYDLAELYFFRDNICLHCTAPDEIKFLFSKLKNFYPDMEFEEANLPSGEVYWVMGKRQHWDDHEGEAFWWMVKQLCSRGWEPLTPNTSHSVNVAYIFRRKAGEPATGR